MIKEQYFLNLCKKELELNKKSFYMKNGKISDLSLEYAIKITIEVLMEYARCNNLKQMDCGYIIDAMENDSGNFGNKIKIHTAEGPTGNENESFRLLLEMNTHIDVINNFTGDYFDLAVDIISAIHYSNINNGFTSTRIFSFGRKKIYSINASYDSVIIEESIITDADRYMKYKRHKARRMEKALGLEQSAFDSRNLSTVYETVIVEACKESASIGAPIRINGIGLKCECHSENCYTGELLKLDNIPGIFSEVPSIISSKFGFPYNISCTLAETALKAALPKGYYTATIVVKNIDALNSYDTCIEGGIKCYTTN